MDRRTFIQGVGAVAGAMMLPLQALARKEDPHPFTAAEGDLDFMEIPELRTVTFFTLEGKPFGVGQVYMQVHGEGNPEGTVWSTWTTYHVARCILHDEEGGFHVRTARTRQQDFVVEGHRVCFSSWSRSFVAESDPHSIIIEDATLYASSKGPPFRDVPFDFTFRKPQ